jgi:hypothetical protein
MKKLPILLLAALFMFSFAACASKKSSDGIDPDLASAADEANKMMPMMADEETRVDKVVFLPQNIFRYVCTLVNYANENIDMLKLKEAIIPILQQNSKETEGLQIFREKQTTLEYQFFDKNGKEAFLISLPFTDY